MTENILLMVIIFLIGAGAMIGFFATKKEGFGRFATSTLLILIVVIISSLLYASGKLNENMIGNIIFAVIGFAGGLFTSKNNDN